MGVPDNERSSVLDERKKLAVIASCVVECTCRIAFQYIFERY